MRTLFELVDEGLVRYVGISAYPPRVLGDVAGEVKRVLGRPVDIVQSYCHYNLQNEALGGEVGRLKDAGVDVVVNASPLGMGLLSGGFPGGFHPAPREMQEKCVEAHRWCLERGETLPGVAMRWAFANWVEKGPTISGASYVRELEENVDAYREVTGVKEGILGRWVDARVDRGAVERMEGLWRGVREVLGSWVGWSWESPPSGYVLWGGKGGSKL